MARRMLPSVDSWVLSFGVRQEWSIQRFWPLLVVVFGVVRIAGQARRIGGWVLLLAVAAVGGLMMWKGQYSNVWRAHI